jgi:hypothetical protein
MSKGSFEDLEWFLTFLGEDIARLKIRDKQALAVDIAIVMGHRVQQSWLPAVPHEVMNRLLKNKGRELTRLQRVLHDFLMKIIKKVRYLDENSSMIEGMDYDVKDADELRSLVRIRPKLEMDLSLEFRESVDDLDSIVFEDWPPTVTTYWPRDALEHAKFTLYTSGSGDESTLKYNFLRALDGLPVTALKTCDECGRWFLQLSKRKRLFCSNRCASKKGSRERYQKIKTENASDYEKELKNGRERSHRSYERKVKTEHPKAKIERRQRGKHKEV